MRYGLIITILMSLMCSACGGAQTSTAALEMRQLEENKALEIINSTLGQKGYQVNIDVNVKLSNEVMFPADVRVVGETVAIEYMNIKDETDMGTIPAAAAGSKLHVIPATVPLTEAQLAQNPPPAPESLYVFILRAADYQYNSNPTSEARGQATYHEVENRLRRDLKDFLAWYESRPR